MSGIDREQVRHVARLARLELTDEEVERLAEELDRVLARFSEIDEAADADGAGPGGEPTPDSEEDDSRLRPDRPDPDPLARAPEELAPEWEDGFFLVPRLEALGRDAEDG